MGKTLEEVSQPISTKAALLITLDTFLETYLHTLDTYMAAQKRLSESMSSGFLSLAQANFTNTTGTRFGQDYYDERMRAVKIVKVEEKRKEDGTIFSFISIMPNASASSSMPLRPGQPEGGQKFGLEETEEQEEIQDNPDPSTEQPSLQREANTSPPPRNPITWFGILVPPALRSAQTSFANVVTEPVPELANLSASLRAQEIAIGRLRKQIRKLP